MRKSIMKSLVVILLTVPAFIFGQIRWDPTGYHNVPQEDRTTIFFDDFDDNRMMWPYIQYGDTWTGKIENGYLYYECKQGSIYNARYVSIDQTSDFELETRIRHVNGPVDQSDGFDWGRNEDGHRESFGFSGNRQYLISRYDGVWNNDISWTPSTLVNEKGYNKLTVRKVGSTYYLFLNEQLVHTMPFRPFFGDMIGFSVNQGITINVDYIRVSYLNLDAASKYSQYSTSDREDIIADDFYDNQNQWWILEQDPNHRAVIEKGHYYIESNHDQYYYHWINPNVDEYKDYEMETRFRNERGAPEIGNSFFWGKPESSWDLFSYGIRNDGQFFLAKNVSGTWQNFVVTRPFEKINQYSANKLTVRKVDSRFYFFINEVLVHTMPYQRSFGPYLGISIGANSAMTVSNLRVSYLSKTSGNTPPVITITEPVSTRGISIVSTKNIRVAGYVRDPDGIYEVKANGYDASIQTDGLFSVNVPLAIGENRITVTAMDTRMMSANRVITVNRESTVVDDPSTGFNEKRLALVMGNSNYTHGGSLNNPVNDAVAMKVALESLGFTVLDHHNCDQRTMRRAMDEFGERLKNYTVGLFFYAGHGIQVNGNNYLIPVDARLTDQNDVEYDCVRAGRILGKMESAGTRTNIVILDACRDNPFERSWSRSAQGKGLAFMNAPSGSLIAYATSPGNTAADGSGRNGLYTSALLEYIHTPNITIEEVFKRVRTSVKRQSGDRQIPWESTSLEGNFYFKK